MILWLKDGKILLKYLVSEGFNIMEKIKVMHVLPKLESGGIEKLIRGWYDLAIQNNIEFEFIVFNSGGKNYEYFTNRGNRIHVVDNIRRSGYIGYIKQFIKIFRESNVDILHIASTPSFSLILIIAKIFKVQSRISHAHTNFYNNTNSNLINNLILFITRRINGMFSTKLLACSREAANYCYSLNKKQLKKYETLLNGIDIDKFSFNIEDRDIIRKEYNLKDYFVIGVVGRLTYQKNIEFVIETFYKVKQRCRDSKLIIIGEGEDEAKLRDLVHQLKIEDDVLFLGVISNIGPLYSSMDVFIFPSRFEGLGIAAIEAQTSGLKSYLSTNVPKETALTNLAKFIPLNKGADYWAETIVNNKEYARVDYSSQIKDSGYSKEYSDKRMINIYFEELDKQRLD